MSEKRQHEFKALMGAGSFVSGITGHSHEADEDGFVACTECAEHHGGHFVGERSALIKTVELNEDTGFEVSAKGELRRAAPKQLDEEPAKGDA